MKFLFLDVDGVLNDVGRGGGAAIDAKRIALLRDVVEITDAVVVVSYSWREDVGRKRVLMLELSRFAIPIFGWTEEGSKVQSIWRYLEDRVDCEGYVVLDDDDAVGVSFGERFVKCSPLDEHSARMAISVLGEKEV